jgi:hypothetical protein
MWNQAAIYRRRRRTFALAAVFALLLIIIIIASGSGGGAAKHIVAGAIALPMSAAPLTYQATAQLQQPVFASTAAPIPGKPAFSLLGGLDSSQNATAEVANVTPTRTATVGTLPVSLYAAAAVTLKNQEYIFGGAEGSAATATPEQGILSYSVLGSGTITEIAHLPSDNYGLSAAAIGGTIYLVGGDDGSATLATIVAWRPGAKAIIVKTLPVALRYAAVAAVGDKLVIAGGLMANKTASDKIFIFNTSTHTIHTLRAKLPTGLYAASGATLGTLAYVIGGQPGYEKAPVGTIYSVDPSTGKLARAGTMTTPRAEAAAVVVNNAIYLAGGLSGATAVADVGTLTVSSTAAQTKTH